MTACCFNTEDPSKYKGMFLDEETRWIIIFFNIPCKYFVHMYLIIACEFRKGSEVVFFFLKLIYEFCIVIRYKISIQKSIIFLYTMKLSFVNNNFLKWQQPQCTCSSGMNAASCSTWDSWMFYPVEPTPAFSWLLRILRGTEWQEGLSWETSSSGPSLACWLSAPCPAAVHTLICTLPTPTVAACCNESARHQNPSVFTRTNYYQGAEKQKEPDKGE